MKRSSAVFRECTVAGHEVELQLAHGRGLGGLGGWDGHDALGDVLALSHKLLQVIVGSQWSGRGRWRGVVIVVFVVAGSVVAGAIVAGAIVVAVVVAASCCSSSRCGYLAESGRVDVEVPLLLAVLADHKQSGNDVLAHQRRHIGARAVRGVQRDDIAAGRRVSAKSTLIKTTTKKAQWLHDSLFGARLNRILALLCIQGDDVGHERAGGLDARLDSVYHLALRVSGHGQ